MGAVSRCAPLPEADVDEYYSSGYSDSNANLRLQGLVFSGPAASVSVSLNLLFSSVAEATIQNPGAYPYAQAMTEAGLTVGLYNTEGGGAVAGDSGQIYSYAGYTPSSFGLLAGYTGGVANLTSAIWEVPTGVPLTLYLGVGAAAVTKTGDNSTGSSDVLNSGALPAEFPDVLNFAALRLGAPLFNLPDGFTVNGRESFVINNVYSPVSSAVPETGQYTALAGLALIGLAMRRRSNLYTVQ